MYETVIKKNGQYCVGLMSVKENWLRAIEH